MTYNEIQTDAIVCWVDGSDPEHAAKRQRTLQNKANKSWHILPAGLTAQRFSDNGELKYCIYSIRKFMPWIRRIFLVTDEQQPSFLTAEACNQLDVQIISHKHIFRNHEAVLPTFNSQSIETAIHRIEGLAEAYIYFNDDVIALQPIQKTDFFCGRKLVLRGRWQPLKKHGTARIIISALLNHIYSALNLRERAMSTLPQYKAAELAGLSKLYIKAPHVPHPVITRTLIDFFHENPDLFEENIKHAFRSMKQFVTQPLAASLEISKGNFILSEEEDYIMIRFSREEMVCEDLKQLITGNYKFVCLQGLDCASMEARNEITEFLEDRIFGTPITHF